MPDNKSIYLETGIYTIPEASRLTRVSTWRIRRWVKGYRFYSSNKPHHSPALWRTQLVPINNQWALGFLDLIEIKCVDSFLNAGVSWATLRKAHTIGVEMFQQSHPFCTHRFQTDGRQLFAEVHEATGEKSLLDIIKKQRIFEGIISPYFKELEFEAGDVLARWRPKTSRRLVVLDPSRSFGHPIVEKHGIPTEILARSAKASSISEIARWYEISEAEIEDAVEFEAKLAA